MHLFVKKKYTDYTEYLHLETTGVLFIKSYFHSSHKDLGSVFISIFIFPFFVSEKINKCNTGRNLIMFVF